MFESRRKTVVTQTETRTLPDEDPAFRLEPDPDPLIEEMVQRLREGLSSMNAYDEWGRPLAWRNVVRLAVGPLAGRLRDAETVAALAVTLAETKAALPATEVDPEPAADEPVEDLVEAVHEAVQEAAEEALFDLAQDSGVPVPYGDVGARPLEDVEVDAAEVEASDDPPATMGIVASRTPAWGAPTQASATSIFGVSGDQRPVGMGLHGTGVEGFAGTYDRFITPRYDQAETPRGGGGR